MPEAHDRWFVSIMRNERPAAQLFCFPFAGGAASAFRSWVGHIPNTVEVLGIQLPGRENRFGEPAAREMQLVVDPLVPLIRQRIRGPAWLVGHSMGALVAFEVARQLTDQVQLGGLAVCGCNPPHLPSPLNSALHQLARDLFVQRLRGLHDRPNPILDDDEVLSVFLPTIQADIELGETYTSEDFRSLVCPLHVFYGLGDVQTRADSMQQWGRFTTGQSAVHPMEGGHFFPFDQPKPTVSRLISLLLGPIAA